VNRINIGKEPVERIFGKDNIPVNRIIFGKDKISCEQTYFYYFLTKILSTDFIMLSTFQKLLFRQIIFIFIYPIKAFVSCKTW